MTAKLLTGDVIANNILAQQQPVIEQLTAQGKKPFLAAIRANDNPGSAWYAKAQAKQCQKAGIGYILETLPENTSQELLLQAIHKFNTDPTISAILLHMPLPAGVSAEVLQNAILPQKDAEGVHAYNLGKLLATGFAKPSPCTALAAFELVKSVSSNWAGKTAVVIGRSAIVGKPAALLLLNLQATVTIAHSRSRLEEICPQADILVVAAGASQAAYWRYLKLRDSCLNAGEPLPQIPDLSPLIKAHHVKPGAVVIDIGVNEIPTDFDQNGLAVENSLRYVGDVDFNSVSEVAGFLTPVKNGAGVITNAILIQNTVNAALADYK